MRDLTAPHVMVALPGTKRVGYTLTDTVWITCHGTHETDLAKLEDELVFPHDHLIEQQGAQLCLGSR
jgi:hypothetical protein